MKIRPEGRTFDYSFAALVFALAMPFAWFVVQSFSGPILGQGDSHEWSYQGYYVRENLSLLPWPRLELVTDQSFYPYGTSQVFRAWALESNLFNAAMQEWLGRGPWIQIHYLASVLITALGCYVLLVKENGRAAAAAIALIVSFGNFYAIAKFPEHAHLSFVHWMTLNIVTDYVLVSRYFRRQAWTARLLLFRVVLLVLAFGMDLGYVLGFALTSFAITTAYITFCDLCQSTSTWPWPRSRVLGWLSSLRTSARGKRIQLVALCLVGAFAAFFYVPLIGQIYFEAQSYTDISSPGIWRATPIRVLVPVLPGTSVTTLDPVWGDFPEAKFDGSPGLFLVLAGSLAFFYRRERMAPVAPAFALLILCLEHNLKDFPILRIFPWFEFFRVGGRCTLVFPVLLGLISLPFWQHAWKHNGGRVVLGLCCLLMCAEFVYAYSVVARPKNYYVPDDRFLSLMEDIRSTPGEALLEWPFFIGAGNGVGTGRLGRYYEYQRNAIQYRQFHEKKVVGDYFGRLHPSQIQPFLDAGWDRMYFPDHEDIFTARHQLRDFNAHEWEFFVDFYTANDFCGILAYADLLPSKTLDGLQSRFGPPAAEAVVPEGGRVLFYPKSKDARGLIDPERGRQLSLEFYLRKPDAVGLQVNER